MTQTNASVFALFDRFCIQVFTGQVSGSKTLAMVEKYFSPFVPFAKSDPGLPVALRVVVRLQDSLADKARKAAQGPVAPVVIDRSDSFLRMSGEYRDDGAVRTVWVAQPPLRIAIDTQRASVEITATRVEDVLTPLIRVIEDTAIDRLEKAGHVFVHGSGVVGQEGAVVFIGQKRSGKSTMMLKSIESFGARFLTSDNILLQRVDDRVIARGWVGFCNLDYGSVVEHGFLRAFLALSWRHRRIPPSDWWGRLGKMSVFTEELVGAAGAVVAQEAPLRQVVVPTFSDDAPRNAPIMAKSLGELMSHNIQGSQHPNRDDDWMGWRNLDHAALKTALIRIFDGATGGIDGRELKWGPSLNTTLGGLGLFPPRVHERQGDQEYADLPGPWFDTEINRYLTRRPAG